MTPKDMQEYIRGVLVHDRRAIAKTITLIESCHIGHKELAHSIINCLMPYTGKAIRIGITGVPGAGKSTFIESLGMFLLSKGHRVAVLAVDPSSGRSGGSVMADKMRMERLLASDNAFIRPSPSGGTLGGVASKTRETMMVCEAAGFDVIIVETVGVGQSETAVASMVDFFLVLMIAGAGDQIQGIKKGILELADAVAINKADGDNIDKAERARRDYETAMHFLSPSLACWTPPVMICSGKKMAGIIELWDTVLEHRKKMIEAGEFVMKRKRQSIDWLWSLVEVGIKERLFYNTEVREFMDRIISEVESGIKIPTAAAAELLAKFDM